MIYRLKATLPKYKTFLRVYEVKPGSTLYALHLFLQNDLSFSPDQQVFFKVYNQSGASAREYGLFDTGHGSMDQVRLESLYKQGEHTFHYVFDIFNDRSLVLQFDGIEDELPRKTYPRTIMERGGDPDQFREEQVSFELNLEEIEPVGGEEGGPE